MITENTEHWCRRFIPGVGKIWRSGHVVPGARVLFSSSDSSGNVPGTHHQWRCFALTLLKFGHQNLPASISCYRPDECAFAHLQSRVSGHTRRHYCRLAVHAFPFRLLPFRRKPPSATKRACRLQGKSIYSTHYSGRAVPRQHNNSCEGEHAFGTGGSKESIDCCCSSLTSLPPL